MSRRDRVAFVFLFFRLACAGFEQPSAITDLIQAGRLSEARQSLTQGLATRPNDAVLWNLLGVVNARENRTAAAEEAFENAVRLAPELPGAWLNLGRLYTLRAANEKQYESKAAAAYQTVLRLDPGNPEAHHQLALLLEWQGRFQDSIAHLNKLPPEDQLQRPALVLWCADEAALGNNQAASKLAQRLLRDPGLEESDVAAILPAVETRNETIALQLLEGLERRKLATTRSLAHLAALYEHRANLAAARRVYESAFQSSPASTGLLLELARIAWKQRDYKGALGYLAHARDVEPANARIHFLFGLASNELNLPIEAKRSLEKALELEPDNPYYNYAAGAVMLQWSDKSEAIPYLKKFVTLRPDDPRGHLALATAWFTQYHHERAVAEARPLLANPQTRAAAEYLLGRIAATQGDFETAIRHFRTLVTLEPESAEGHAELASALFEMQDPGESRRETECALGIAPDNYVANRTLLRIYRASGDPRVKQQSEKLQKLVETHEEQAKLLQRTIEVRPW